VGNTNENNIVNKITNHIGNEKVKIIEYQKKSWAEAKEQTAKNFATIKSWFVKN
jgi:transcription antitermination factor NusA-like protein